MHPEKYALGHAPPDEDTAPDTASPFYLLSESHWRGLLDTLAMTAYHFDGIPTVYIIGRQGEVVAANPNDIPQVVNHELAVGR
jgi:hypothetical protein